MAVRALPPGAIRRRAFFGLLDADGWAAAFFKALFWFLLIIFLLGYVPDRAYYFTVSKTIELGFNAVPIVNLCPASNLALACPAPDGAVVPWGASPEELALPEPRAGAAAFQSGNEIYLIGGRTADGATGETLATRATTDGNFAAWAPGPALPEARSDFAYASLSGVPYVIGGSDASGAPTTTVYEGTVEEGVLTGWEAPEALQLPVAISDATAVPTGDGIYLVGGRSAEGLSDAVYRAAFDEANPPTLQAWQEIGLPLPEPRADAVGFSAGDLMFIVGGEGPDGISRSVFRLELDEGEPLVDSGAELPKGWAIAPESQQLPAPRTRASTFNASGVYYVVGGVDETGQLQESVAWVTPAPLTGDLPGWQRLDLTDLPEPRADLAMTAVGPFAFAIGGEGPAGLVEESFRANTSPAPPFFRLGLFGATLPAMAIEGEIGQQLGYINAFGVGMTFFVVLVLIGLAYSHRQGTMRVIERVSRGRFRAPREEEYSVFEERR